MEWGRVMVVRVWREEGSRKVVGGGGREGGREGGTLGREAKPGAAGWKVGGGGGKG